MERFLKDHVKLKTGVMAAENVALPKREINYISKYSNRKHFNISQYCDFYSMFDQINAAFVKHFFQKHLVVYISGKTAKNIWWNFKTERNEQIIFCIILTNH